MFPTDRSAAAVRKVQRPRNYADEQIETCHD